MTENILPAGAPWATGREGGNDSHQAESMVPDPNPCYPLKGQKNPVM